VSLNDPRFASRLAESAGVVGNVNCSALRFGGFNLATAWLFKTYALRVDSNSTFAFLQKSIPMLYQGKRA